MTDFFKNLKNGQRVPTSDGRIAIVSRVIDNVVEGWENFGKGKMVFAKWDIDGHRIDSTGSSLLSEFEPYADC